MRITLTLSAVALLIGLSSFIAGGQIPATKSATKSATVAGVQPADKSGGPITEDQKVKPAENSRSAPQVTPERSADEAAIRQADEAFVKAYGEGDAKAIAALFTPDAEYVDEAGNLFQGREAIEQTLVEFFSENPDCQLEMTIDSIRFVSPGIAIEDGSTILTHPELPDTIASRYTTIYVKSEGKWLAASVRDYAPKDRRQHRLQLEQLDWLLGDWVDEAEDSVITFSCQSVDNGNFLLRQFTILIGGEEVMSGTQRIGWDPLTGKLRTWIFDSEGSYGEGSWHRDGDRWILKCTGVMPDGQTASSTSIYTSINSHTMTWQLVDHEIAGVQQPDSEIYSIVRQAPPPAPLVSDQQE
ncbi:MAG TPA: SgcJ/EcaC family oxidoreductase [Planctomycetaceae bacterium]|nr:SgcJ/EcaC family oxidoreductase [Planctomycetaceae bacterium]